jgi:glycosyltransferase involved in cell wall biosynthesis
MSQTPEVPPLNPLYHMPSVSVVIPVYNSELSLPELCDRLSGVLRRVSKNFELIMVNDCSRDNSWDVIGSLAARHSWIRGINLMRNYGQHNALLCGIRAAQHETIVTLDDDLQHPPEEIPKLLQLLSKGHDVVYGTPQKEQHGLLRDIASRVTKLSLQSAMGAQTARQVSAFRAFNSKVRDSFANYNSSFVSIDVLLTWGTTRFAAVSVRHDPRHIGVSNYTFRKLVVHALNMLTGFSTWPLQFASLSGFAFTVFGIGVLIYVLGRFVLYGSSVAGFPFLASVISIFSGAQLFALGVIGEYLARMHFRMMERPAFTIRQQISFQQTAD